MTTISALLLLAFVVLGVLAWFGKIPESYEPKGPRHTTGYRDISRQEIMNAVGASGPVVNYHFGTMDQFRRALMRYAIQHECLAVIAQGLAASDPHARKAPEELRRAALDSLM